jgi:sulfatase modifying factor 1
LISRKGKGTNFLNWHKADSTPAGGVLLVTFLSFVFGLLGLCPPDMAFTGRVCMDRYEAPNIEGEPPLVMQSAFDGETWCKAWGKRLCTEAEWEFACDQQAEGPCNNQKLWLPWDPDQFAKGVDYRAEVKRLWQGEPAGSFPKCRTPSGIFDLTGSVEEWVKARKGRDYPYTMKGGFWAKKTGCRGSNDAHEPSFRFYETGARCCLSPY